MNPYIKISFYVVRFFLVAIVTMYLLESILEFLLENPDNSFGVWFGLIGNIFGVVVIYWMYKQIKKGWKYIKESDKGYKYGK